MSPWWRRASSSGSGGGGGRVRRQLDRPPRDDDERALGDGAERLRRLAEQVQPVARERVGRQQPGARLLGDDDHRRVRRRDRLHEPGDLRADVAAAEHDARDPRAEPVEQDAVVLAQRAREVVADVDRLPLRRAAQDVGGDPRGHRAVVGIGGGEVADGQPGGRRERLGVGALARPRGAEDERQAHVGSRAAAATRRPATCGKAAQWTCMYDACTPPAT